MTYQVRKSDLYQTRYQYVWLKDKEERAKHTPYAPIKIDISDGYVVLDIIQSVYDQKRYVFCGFVGIYEQLLHNPEIAQIQSLEEIKQRLIEYV